MKVNKPQLNIYYSYLYLMNILEPWILHYLTIEFYIVVFLYNSLGISFMLVISHSRFFKICICNAALILFLRLLFFYHHVALANQNLAE